MRKRWNLPPTGREKSDVYQGYVAMLFKDLGNLDRYQNPWTKPVNTTKRP